MLCLKKRRTYSFTQGVCADLPRRSKKDPNQYGGSLDIAITTLPRKNRSREERPSRMVLTVTEDTPADMLAGSMELLVQLPRDHHLHTQKVTVQRSTPMMDLLVQIATAHKLAASSYTLQAIGERGMVLPHQPNTPIGALDALQVKLLPKQGTFIPRKTKQANQPFETTFRLQVHLPRNQLYVSRVSPKMNLGDILDEVCREKNLDRNKYELRHPANLEETLDLSLSLQDYHLQEVTLYAKQGRTLGSALSTQDIMALQRQEERRRQQAKQGVFGFIFKKSKEGSLSTDSLGGRSTSPARSDETARSTSPLQPPARPQRKRRPAPKPPIQNPVAEENVQDSGKDKVVISHSRNSSDSSGYHEASVLSDNPDSAGRLPETLPRRNRAPGGSMDTPRKLVQTSQSSKSLGNLATVSGTLSHGISTTSLSSTGLRKKRAAPPPPATRPLSSAISTQGLERIVDSEESLTSDMDPSKPPSDIGASSKASSDIEERPKASSDIGISTVSQLSIDTKLEFKSNSSTGSENPSRPGSIDVAQAEVPSTVTETTNVETARVIPKRGKLVRSQGSIENNHPSYSFISKNSFEQVLEVSEGTELKVPNRSRLCGFGSERMKLQTRIESFKAERRILTSLSNSSSNSPKLSENKSSREVPNSGGGSLDSYRPQPKPRTKLQKSQSFACTPSVKLAGKPGDRTLSLQTNEDSNFSRGSLTDKNFYKTFECLDTLSQSRLVKMETLANLDGIETDIENMPDCGVLENRFSPKRLHLDNYICNDKCSNNLLKHCLSFKGNSLLRETKIVSEFEKPVFTNSHSFSVKGKKTKNFQSGPEINSRPCFKPCSGFSSNSGLNSSSGFSCNSKFNSASGFKSSSEFIATSNLSTSSNFNTNSNLNTSPNLNTSSKLNTNSSLNTSPNFSASSKFNTNSSLNTSPNLNISSGFNKSPKLNPTPNLNSNSNLNSSQLPKLGKVTTTKCYNTSIICTRKTETLGSPEHCQSRSKTNLSPPPLSNLQIFAISTKPLDIQVETVDPIPTDIDTLPSLPIIQHSECKLETEKKLSILEPPPPDDPAVGIPPLPMPRKANSCSTPPKAPKRRIAPLSTSRKLLNSESEEISTVSRKTRLSSNDIESQRSKMEDFDNSLEDEVFFTPMSDKAFEIPPGSPIEFYSDISITKKQLEESESEVNSPQKLIEKPKDCKISEKEKIEVESVKSIKDSETLSFDYQSSEGPTDENPSKDENPCNDESFSKEEKKNSIKHDKNPCSVISTIPKCEHLESLANKKASAESSNVENNPEAYQTVSEEGEERKIDVDIKEEQQRDSKDVKWIKLFRTTSKSNDFEMNSLERQKRHLTCPVEDITFALNLNVASHLELNSQEGGKSDDWTIRREDTVEDACSVGGNEEKTQLVDGGITGNRENGPIDTEVLLQKVSDTLSSRLPSEEVSTESQKKNQVQTESISTAKSVDSTPTIGKSPPTSEEVSERGGKDCVDRPAEGVLNNSTGSGTVVSQQDTSDYVSAVDEDLSIPDWEYQLPAPPSAFRDTASPVFNDYDTITLGSVEAFKEPIAHIVDEDTGSEQKSGEKQELGKPVRSGEAKSARSEKMDKDEKIADVREKDEGRGTIRDRKVSEDEIVIENAKVTESRKVTEDRKITEVRKITEDRKLAESNNRAERKEEKASTPLSLEDNNKRAEEKPVKLLKKSEPSLELKKEVINELETKLVSGALPQGKDGDSRRVESISTPKVAPVDNTLSNFTITTYSRQKSLDIFDETDKSSSTNKISDERFMKSFPTLTRNRFAHESEIGTRDSTLSMLQSKRSSLKDDYASLGDVQLRKEPKIREDVQRVMENRGNEKVTVQRSRSYISAPENSKQDARDTEDYESNSVSLGGTDAGIKKSNSVRNLNPNGPKFNEKFSQWRENILKKQEEPTKEKQLQSLQVLKSILPQLKSAQQAEENVPKENGTALPEEKRSETGSNEHSAESNVVLTPESQPLRTEKQSEVESRKINTEKNAAKRYTYTGPPAISLGSWSERPSVNVQIKMDTDYKFGGAKWNTSNSRTIVTINGTTDETDSPKVSSNIEKPSGNKIESVSEKKASNELAKKLISHTTASGFKKPVQHSTYSSDPKGPIDKPIVTGVELKKPVNEKNEVKNNNNTIDTSPVNFRELSKAFGQDVCLRPKPKRLNPNRRSEYLESDAQAQNIDSSIKQNGHGEMANSNLVTENQNNLRPKRFTSVVGITQSNNVSHSTSFPFRAGTNIKTNTTAPVVKGFKLAGPTTNSLSEKLQKVPNGIPNENGSIPQPPKPSTMPVITGVTLKSASSRPKSMPVQIDPRDNLLESIRNFGGRGNLKSAAKKC